MKLKNMEEKEEVWIEDIMGADTTNDSGCLLNLNVEVRRASEVNGKENVKLVG